MLKRLMSTMACSLVTMIIVAPLPALAQNMQSGTSLTKQQMLDRLVGPDTVQNQGALQGLGASRGITLGAPAKAISPENLAQKQFMRSFLQKSQTRAPILPGPQLPASKLTASTGTSGTLASTTSAADRTQLTKIIKQNKLPAIDLEIYFDYNSAQIKPRSVPDLVALGQVLGDAKLAGSTFLVAGHTDATGGSRYNLSLSERRAHAVEQFLSASFGIKSGTLVTVGYGEEQLKNGSNPSAAENRRVQIVNLRKMQ